MSAHDQLALSTTYPQIVELERRLSGDATGLPKWRWPALQHLLGPLAEQEIVVIAARPGSGKTTTMLSQALSMTEHGHRVWYVSTETSAWVIRARLAAQALSLPVHRVVQLEWDALPAGSREAVIAEAARQARENSSLVIQDGAITVPELIDVIEQAGVERATVFVDHLHEVGWGHAGDRFSAMSAGVQALKDCALDHGVRLVFAAQLRRPGGYDPLAEYLVPDQGSIKQSGTVEEVAHTVILLHRSLRSEITDEQLSMVRRGQLRIRDVAEHGTVSAYIGKARLRGESQGLSVRLYVANGEVFNSPAERARKYPQAEWERDEGPPQDHSGTGVWQRA